MLARSLSSEMDATDDGAQEPEPEATTPRDEATDFVADKLLCRSSSGRLCGKCEQCDCLHPDGNHTFRTIIERTLSDPTLTGTPDSTLRARTTSSAEVQLSAEKKKNRALQLHMRDAAGQERLVAFDIDPKELSATWDDQKIHGDEEDWKRAHRGHTKEDCYVCKGETDLWRICPVTSRTWDSLSPAQHEQKQLKANQLRRVETGGALRGGAGSDSDDGDEDDGMRTTSISNLQESQGAHGIVRRAVWKKTIKVAIKENTIQTPNDEEMKLFRDLHHPHIVTCYGILREDRDGKPATSIVTERCTTSLSKFLSDDCNWEYFRKEPLSDDEIGFRKLTILEHVAQGLDRLHDLSVLHRDIKCQNILLDGEPGTCATCGHAGRWKICDFGEATSLRTPMLSFHPPKVWCGAVSEGRYQRITSAELQAHGATHYCWIHPGETFATIAGAQSLPAVYAKELSLLDPPDLKRRARELLVPQKWLDQAKTGEEGAHDIISMILCPFPDGALVYSFSKSEDRVDPNASDDRDSVFCVRSSSAWGEAHQKSFPEALRPFSVVPWTELKGDQLKQCVSLNLNSCKYTITPESFCGPKLPPQLTCLKSLYDSRGGIKGSISAPHEIKRTTSLKVTSSAQLPETKYHTALPQESNGRKLPQDKARWCCEKTGDTLGDGPGKTTSLWINLSDGFIGGGRKEWDGSGGNGTAIEHYEEMLARGKHYPLAVKLGTITADGADVYSYAADEDDSVYVPADRLTELLARWGVDTTRLEKTEQAMQELELEKIQEALWRRRERIPKNATHYVWAYQLEPWEADKNFKHLDILQQHTGEISLASYGGKIYFTYDGETGEPVVVGINAITLSDKETARPEFVGGIVERHDDHVSAHVASPELWDGFDIGLETDVYLLRSIWL